VSRIQLNGDQIDRVLDDGRVVNLGEVYEGSLRHTGKRYALLDIGPIGTDELRKIADLIERIPVS
jgi:hypothetical protein